MSWSWIAPCCGSWPRFYWAWLSEAGKSSWALEVAGTDPEAHQGGADATARNLQSSRCFSFRLLLMPLTCHPLSLPWTWRHACSHKVGASPSESLVHATALQC